MKQSIVMLLNFGSVDVFGFDTFVFLFVLDLIHDDGESLVMVALWW